MTITPHVQLLQTSTHIQILLRVPHIRVSKDTIQIAVSSNDEEQVIVVAPAIAESNVDDEDGDGAITSSNAAAGAGGSTGGGSILHVSCPPYYIKLNFAPYEFHPMYTDQEEEYHHLEEEEEDRSSFSQHEEIHDHYNRRRTGRRPHAIYEPNLYNGILRIELKKRIPYEIWDHLDLLGQLVSPSSSSSSLSQNSTRRSIGTSTSRSNNGGGNTSTTSNNTNPRWLREVVVHNEDGINQQQQQQQESSRDDNNQHQYHHQKMASLQDDEMKDNEEEKPAMQICELLSSSSRITGEKRIPPLGVVAGYGFLRMFHGIFTDLIENGLAYQMVSMPWENDTIISATCEPNCISSYGNHPSSNTTTTASSSSLFMINTGITNQGNIEQQQQEENEKVSQSQRIILAGTKDEINVRIHRFQQRYQMEQDHFNLDRYIDDLDIQDDYVYQCAMSIQAHWYVSFKNTIITTTMKSNTHYTSTNRMDISSIATSAKNNNSININLCEQLAQCHLLDDDNNQIQDTTNNDKQQSTSPVSGGSTGTAATTTLYFTADENLLLLSIPYPLLPEFISNSQHDDLLIGLLDILFAYVYDHITTDGEPTVESAWTISILSASLSCLEDCILVSSISTSSSSTTAAGLDHPSNKDNNHYGNIPPSISASSSNSIDTRIGSVIQSSMRRVLIYPYLRNYELGLYVWKQVVILLQGQGPTINPLISNSSNSSSIRSSTDNSLGNGDVRPVIRCLLQTRRILDKSELYYLGNKLYIDPYLAWLQRYATIIEAKLLYLAQQLQEIISNNASLLKGSLNLPLEDYENCEQQQEQETNATSEEESTSNGDDDDDDDNSYEENDTSADEKSTNSKPEDSNDKELKMSLNVDTSLLQMSAVVPAIVLPLH